MSLKIRSTLDGTSRTFTFADAYFSRSYLRDGTIYSGESFQFAEVAIRAVNRGMYDGEIAYTVQRTVNRDGTCSAWYGGRYEIKVRRAGADMRALVTLTERLTEASRGAYVECDLARLATALTRLGIACHVDSMHRGQQMKGAAWAPQFSGR